MISKKQRQDAIRVANMIASNLNHGWGPEEFLPYQIWYAMGETDSLTYDSHAAGHLAAAAAQAASRKKGLRTRNGFITKEHYAEAECMLREGWEPEEL